MTAGGNMDKKKLLALTAGICIAIAAVWLRLLYIDTDFWYDEACSWVTASKDFPFGIMDNLLHLDLQHTPLYFFLLHFWMKIFGENEIAIRSLSVIFGIAAVPVTFVVSKKLFSNKIAILSTAIAAVSPVLCFFSVEARMYPAVVFLVLLSLNYLIDFEQKENNFKSLIKLVITNLLIPYTFVGGIFYNIALWCCYGKYLHQTNKPKFKLYCKGLIAELTGLIPYIILIAYYAKMRSIFIVKHEGLLAFANVVEAIRNFFGATLVDNIYWPAVDTYTVDFLFAALVVLPCVYFIYGIVQGFKKSDGFVKTLYNIFILIFVLAVVSALFQINVFTVRYILYLLPPLFILSVYGLSKKISMRHLTVFAGYFIICSLVFNFYYSVHTKDLKTKAFRAVQYEVKQLGFGADDLLILPFGADAPYYFRTSDTPRVFDFDFHKQARNPYNNDLYDKKQQKVLAGAGKYELILDAVYEDKIFSDNFYKYFINNVNKTVPSGHYVVIALYSSDANSLVTIDELRKSIVNPRDVENRTVDILLKKFMYDIRLMLSYDFLPVKSYTKDNYTYVIYRKP